MKRYKSKHELKILLLQIREDELTMQEEYQEFVRFSHLQPHQIDKLNVFEHRTFGLEVLDGYDALFIGGSSDASVQDLETYYFVHSCKALLRHCYNTAFPVLASCFGFQIAVDEFKGKVIIDKPNMEMGLYQIQLNNNRYNDPLLFDYPETFWAVSGHQERALLLPSNAINLASSQQCPYHIFTFSNKPFYAFQFHPEVDNHDLISRITRYQQRYLTEQNSLQDIIDKAIHPTTESNQIIQHFIDRIICHEH